MTDSNSLSSIAVGDVVAIRGWKYGISYSSTKVTKLTPTQIVCVTGRFDRKSGEGKGHNKYWNILTGKAGEQALVAVRLRAIIDALLRPFPKLTRSVVEDRKACIRDAEAWLRESGEWDTAAPKAEKGPDHG